MKEVRDPLKKLKYIFGYSMYAPNTQTNNEQKQRTATATTTSQNVERDLRTYGML